MSMIYRWILFIALFGISLSCSDHPKNSSSDMEPLDIVELRPADKWLKFPIDEDTDIGWYPTVIEKDEREYIIIKNSGMPQLLFYDVDKMECVRKITFQMEGPNAIGKAHRYYVKGWSEFYWLPPSAQQCLFKVDDAGVVQGCYDCSKDDAGNFLPPIQKEISPRTLAALLKVQQMGVHIVLASGRPTNGVMPIAEKLELNHYGGYILSYNGGQIINVQTGELLFEKRIDPEWIPYFEKKAKKNDFAIFTYHKDFILTDKPDNKYVIQEANLNKMQIVGVDNFAEAVDFPPCKCMLASDDEEALIGLENHWKKRLDGVLDAFRSEPYFLEVVPQFIDKGNTLGVLMTKLSVSPEEVIAIGDGVCDVTMLQLAGVGIAMGNAEDSVKACVDKTTLTNEEEGVAVAVERTILAEIRPTEVPLDQLNMRARHALMGNLGIQYTYASEDRVEATMPVDERTRQPFGILHGGATLALAETVAGLGSMILAKPDEIVVGMQVSGNHMSSAHEGDTVRAVGTIIHKGRSSHVWNVDVFTSTDKLVSSIRVVNSILKKK